MTLMDLDARMGSRELWSWMDHARMHGLPGDVAARQMAELAAITCRGLFPGADVEAADFLPGQSRRGLDTDAGRDDFLAAAAALGGKVT